MIAAGIKKSTSQCNALFLAELVEDKLVEAPQALYDASKEGVKTPLFNLFVDIVQQGKMDSMVMRNIGALIQSDRNMDALSGQIAG